MTRSYDAVVLAGGAARRLGGTDKPALAVGGRSLLDRVLDACGSAGRTVVVGPRRPTARPVRWTREAPPGGGPLPAVAAGLTALDSLTASIQAPVQAPSQGQGQGQGQGRTQGQGAVRSARSDVLVLLAADLPFFTAVTVDALLGALAGADPAAEGVLLVDAGGRDQPLAAAYRTEPLRRELALLAAEHGGLTGLPLRLLTTRLDLRQVADPTGVASFDCDTWEDVAAARARIRAASEG